MEGESVTASLGRITPKGFRSSSVRLPFGITCESHAIATKLLEWDAPLVECRLGWGNQTVFVATWAVKQLRSETIGHLVAHASANYYTF